MALLLIFRDAGPTDPGDSGAAGVNLPADDEEEILMFAEVELLFSGEAEESLFAAAGLDELPADERWQSSAVPLFEIPTLEAVAAAIELV